MDNVLPDPTREKRARSCEEPKVCKTFEQSDRKHSYENFKQRPKNKNDKMSEKENDQEQNKPRAESGKKITMPIHFQVKTQEKFNKLLKKKHPLDPFSSGTEEVIEIPG